ncbi:copper resistance protein NlpE [Shewanella rhizosphaerae]|uniref:copper resistance protein NlpE n=1 Tax=Shewanella TaxID=22 RepID=UPI001C6590A9|nr:MULTISPECIES: copper resistance protein NlpE [Shewanella]QYJ81739.1 copper resistance protein NlpE [Shewanella aegiceratis]QYK12210.1 copper resistance protein NlpE [Shewanella rhizosphaerae]
MKISARLLPLVLLTLGACAQQSSQAPEPQTEAPASQASEPQAAQTMPLGDTSRNALDWPGLYKGTLPCADCEGIAMSLKLNGDNSYQLSQQYLGKQNLGEQNLGEQNQATDVVLEGQFSWNEMGSKITLDSKARGMKLQVGENILFMLDDKGERIKGALAQQYQLLKAN